MKHIFSLMLFLIGVATMMAQDIVVTDFGARGDGVTLNTRSIQAAVDSASARYLRSGKTQTVVVPEGRFVSGTLYLKSGVTLRLDSLATLLGSTNPFDYIKDPYCKWTAFIFAVKQHDIGICGKGTIDGRGFEVAYNMVGYIHQGLVQDPLKYDRPNEANRPENIHFRECDNIIIRGITLKNPASWNQQYDQCRHLIVEDQTVDSKSFWNNDGIDIVDCQDVLIRNCDMDAADDVFCFKSHSVDGLSENVTVENCTGRSSANGIKFGTMTRGHFRHFRFKNITIRDTYRSAITVDCVDGGTVEDIVFDSIRSLHTGNPLFLRFDERLKGTGETRLKDITLRNFYAEVPFEKPDAGYNYEGPVEDQPRNISPSGIVGTSGMRIENVLLENVELVYPGRADSAYAYCGSDPKSLASIAERESQYPEFSMFKELPAWGLYIRHADNITLRNVTLRVGDKDYRPAIVSDDVRGLVLENVSVIQPDAPRKVQLVANNTQGLKMPHTSLRLRKSRSEHVSQAVTDMLNPDERPTYRASLFGIKSNGTTDNTASIQHAIDHIAEQGGGVLEFFVGRYLTGGIRLRSNVDIILNEGAILVFTANPYDYPDGVMLSVKDEPSKRGEQPLTPTVSGLGLIESHLDIPVANQGGVQVKVRLYEK